MFVPPPLKDKPPSPVASLPVPKRKGVAVLIVAVPAVAGLGIGAALALLARWLGGFISGRWGGILTQIWLTALIIALALTAGAYVGFRTLMSVLTYGALEREGKVLKNHV